MLVACKVEGCKLLHWIVGMALVGFSYHSATEMLGHLRDVRYGRMSNHQMMAVLILSPVIMAAGYTWALGRFVLSLGKKREMVFAVASKNR